MTTFRCSPRMRPVGPVNARHAPVGVSLHMGAKRRSLPDLVGAQGQALCPDVTESQSAILENQTCQSEKTCCKVSSGRTQAAVTSQWGLGQRAIPPAALQKNWSRGCRRAKSFWPCALSPSVRLAHRSSRKSSTLTSLCRSSRPTPASTSKAFGRTPGANRARSAQTAAQFRACTHFGGVTC